MTEEPGPRKPIHDSRAASPQDQYQTTARLLAEDAGADEAFGGLGPGRCPTATVAQHRRLHWDAIAADDLHFHAREAEARVSLHRNDGLLRTGALRPADSWQAD